MSDKLTVGQLVYKISGDMDNLKTELQKTDAKVKELERSMEKTTKTTKKTTGAFSAFKLAAVAIYGYLAVQLKRAIQNTIRDASDLTESVNAVNVVFGEGASKVLAYGKNAAKSVGLATSEYNQLATITGALLKDTGLTMDQVAEKTNELTIRAADMASVFNTDVKDALSAVNQAIRGETEAIRRYAGDVTDATLEQYLLSQGINKSVTELTAQEKRLYRVDLIMKQTSITAGDFANTSNTLANRQRILAAQTKNMSANFGRILLPALESVVGQIDISGLASEKAGAKFDNMGKTVFQITNFVIAMGKAFILVIKVLTGFVDVLVSVGKTQFNFFKDGIKGLTSFKDNWKALASGVGKALKGDFKGALTDFKTRISDVFSGTSQSFSELSTKTTAWADVISEQFDSVGDSAVKAIDAVGYKLPDAAEGGMSQVAGSAENMAQGVKEGSDDAIKSLEEFQSKLLSLIDTSEKTREEIGTKLSESMSKFGDDLKNNISESVSGMADIVLAAEKSIEDLKKRSKETEDSGERKDIKKQIKEQEAILDAREDYEERQANRIAAIRSSLEEKGIDVAQAGLDSILSIRSLEDEIAEKKRVASLDEFTRFEEEQANKLVLLTENFLAEATMLQSKLDTQKQYEAELTSYLVNENDKRLANTDEWAKNTIDKYQDVAASLRSLISTQSQVRSLGSFTPASASAQNVAPANTGNVTTTNNNISAPVNISGQNVKNLSAQEISSILGFELNKHL